MAAVTVSAEELYFMDPGFEGLENMDIVPEVLTATRLKQARAEVPGSMTVITADDIAHWGVRTIPELMRFVPGMFVKHGSDDAVAYHASNPSLMRRMQVLIDGRSVYRAGIASVNWEDIPVALGDIQQIEVFRGPNASSYGANAFMAVINIVTFHPADTLGSRAFIRHGDQGVRDYEVSHSAQAGDWVYRVTAASKEDDGFDGRDKYGDGDNYHDGSRDTFISFNAVTEPGENSRLLIEGAYKNGDLRMVQTSQDEIAPVDENKSGFLMARLQHDFSAKHTSQLKTYWQREKRHIDFRKCGPAVTLSPRLGDLYLEDPYWAASLLDSDFPQDQLPGIAFGTAQPEDVEAAVEAAIGRDYDISQDDLDAVQAILAEAGFSYDALTADVCGTYVLDFDEQRFDVEWQDTVQWADNFRTVSGVSYRRDEATSETYFAGSVKNDLFRAFLNTEWRPLQSLVLNAGGMYEDEDKNSAVFSPRLAANILFTPQQSLRFVWSTAVRSPDLLEQSPEYSLTVTDLTDNYLGLSEGTYFATQYGSYGKLDHERIISSEIGYYGRFPEQKLELDIKAYYDRLFQLISNPINLQTPDVNSDTRMNISGLDWQFSWQPVREHSLWYAGAYVDTDVELGDMSMLTANEERNLRVVETRLSAEYSHNLSWSYLRGSWQFTQSYFWHRSYNRDTRNPNPYRRYEAHVHKNWPLRSIDITTDLFYHHIIADNAIVYSDQYIEESDLIDLQVGVKF
ncbi:MAG: TonB-dependent receptor [Thalassolituus sp.]